MTREHKYQKSDQVWVWAYSEGGEKIIRPATVLLVLDKKYVFQQEEEHVLVRYEDKSIRECECIPIRQIAGIREE